ncbi:phosphopentomutase [Rhodobacterales bacterium HKCCE4037]|nr:phosphopentomutase [Rhodobacterales bacterium HKCCE4037]
MARAFLVVMDSVGIGGAPDADKFFNDGVPDTGSNTVGHIAQACAEGRAEEGRSGLLNLPNLDALGLGAAVRLASGARAEGLDALPEGLWGVAEEVSPGKDTPTGHWELAGLPVPWDWTYFADKTDSFPDDLIAEVCRLAGTEGIHGNKHSNGVKIIEEFGAQHQRDGWPICYTSADSVFQIAAHEESFGLQRLLTLCEDIAPTLHEMRVGRVIARPFVGRRGDYTRTSNRRDFAIEPPKPTLLDWAVTEGRQTYAIGKIKDIFAGRGVTHAMKGPDAELMAHLATTVDEAVDGSLTFANFVEFDSLYGHRRDISGYAGHLEWFDAAIAPILAALRPDDLMIFTADHGNDPSWTGTDHTRERVPVLAAGPYSGQVGVRGFVDVAASVAHHLGLDARGAGESFL